MNSIADNTTKKGDSSPFFVQYPQTRSAYQGFTLIELLVVIAIIGLLASLVIPVVEKGLVTARRTHCASNQRQIGTAIIAYAVQNAGRLPPTTHSTGGFRREESWIYILAPFLSDMDLVRVCPADPAKRRKLILERKATSYVLNDLVFDDYEFSSFDRIPAPPLTRLLFVLSENRSPSTTRDHIHGGEWSTWSAVLNDIEPDRHRSGGRQKNRLKGSSNYLFADGHVENVSSIDLKKLLDQGVNPAAVPAR